MGFIKKRLAFLVEKQNKQKKELLVTHHLKVKNVNYIGDVTSPM